METDIAVQDEGSVVLFHPNTPAAREWLDEHVQEDAQWFGNALVVEHRYADELVRGITGDGLTVGGW